MKRYSLAPRKRIVIEPGASFECANPSWERPFSVERTEIGTRVYYLCRFTEPDPTMTDDRYDFDRFVAVWDKPSGIVEVQNFGQLKKDKPFPVDAVSVGNALLERLQCPGCKAVVRMRSKVLRRARELVVTQYTCPKCGYKDVDYFD